MCVNFLKDRSGSRGGRNPEVVLRLEVPEEGASPYSGISKPCIPHSSRPGAATLPAINPPAFADIATKIESECVALADTTNKIARAASAQI